MNLGSLLRLVSPIDRLSQAAYRRASSVVLKKCGVHVEGTPLWVSPDTYWDNPRKGLISVGDRCVISHGVRLLTHDFSLDRVNERMNGITDQELILEAPISIGRQAFVGMGATIMPGVTIGDGAIVGAGSVVTKDVPADAVFAGNPAKFICSTGDLWIKSRKRFKMQQRRA